MDNLSERDKLLRLYEAHGTVSTYLEAVPLYKQAIAENPDQVDDYFFLAFMHERRAQQLLSEAAKLYEQALAHAKMDTNGNPSYYKVLNHLTRNYIRTGNTHQAIQYMKELIIAEPENSMLYCSLCNCYMMADQPDDAEKVINAAMKLDSRNAYVLYYAGEVAKRKERYEQALKYWRQSYALDNDLCDNLYSMAFLLEFQHRYAEAIAVWREIIVSLEEAGGNIETEMPKREIAKLETKIQTESKKETGC